MSVSERAKSVDSSGIRRVFDLASSLKNPINLSIGQPDFDAFLEVKEAAKQAIDAGKNSYTVTQGIEELRNKIRAKYRIDSEGDEFDAFVTAGVSGGLSLSYMTLLDPGDEILIPDPFFCIYRDLALLVSAVPTYYDCYPDFSLSLSAIEAAISPRTKAIVVNSPGNPTGVALKQSELDGLVELSRKHDLWIIYDEIYEAFCFDDEHATPFRQYEKVVVLNGFSKSHGVPGWRLGFAVAPSAVVKEMLKIQQYTFVCSPAALQWGILQGADADLSGIREDYRKKRDFIYDALKDNFSLVKPTGAFYAFPEAPGGSGQAFVEKCIENNLLVVPGHVFSRRDSHFRVSFSAPMEQLVAGAEILNRLAK